MTEENKDILGEKDFQNFVSDRKISTTDYILIQQLAKLPKDVFLEHHNSFSSVKYIEGGVKRMLEIDKKLARQRLDNACDDQGIKTWREQTAYCDLMMQIAERYDGVTAYALNCRFERRNRSLWQSKE